MKSIQGCITVICVRPFQEVGICLLKGFGGEGRRGQSVNGGTLGTSGTGSVYTGANTEYNSNINVHSIELQFFI